MADNGKSVRVISPDRTETLDVFGARVSVMSDGSNVRAVLGDQEVPPGYGVPPHVHAGDDEVFCVLAGELVLSGPDGETTARSGDVVQLPRGVPHGFRNATAAPARLLAILLPGTQGLAMFRAFHAARETPGGLSPQAAATIAAEHGVRFV